MEDIFLPLSRRLAYCTLLGALLCHFTVYPGQSFFLNMFDPFYQTGFIFASY